MVSTRGPRSRYFEKGEKVLCYEPDPSKAKVLYDSKILGIYDTKDKRGRKIIQYKVHFQGWSSSWDRKVSADFLLKDNKENRQLQRDLAERAQLQLGSYLYRKDRANKKRFRKSVAMSEDSIDTNTSANKMRSRGFSEDNFSSSSALEKQEDDSTKDDFGSKQGDNGDGVAFYNHHTVLCLDCESDSCGSSTESFYDEDRVMLLISERLRQYLEFDNDMIVKMGKQHILPAATPVVTILENFVKQTALRMIFSTISQIDTTRRRHTQQRTDKKEKENDKIITTIGLLKEVADGLRIYFDFNIMDYLLYKEEKDYVFTFLSKENLKKFKFASAQIYPLELFNATLSSTGLYAPSDLIETLFSQTGHHEEQPQRRKLRSYRDDCGDLNLDNYLTNIPNICSSSISGQLQDFIQNILLWRLLPSNVVPVPSMIFGATHLARLIVKLPDYLNASSINDKKLKILLQHLDSFTNYLQAHKEWFTDQNYISNEVWQGVSTTNSSKCEKTTTFVDNTNDVKFNSVKLSIRQEHQRLYTG